MRSFLTPAIAAAVLIGTTALPAAAVRPTTPGPAHFTTTIDNPFLPFVPGTRMVYRSTDAGETGREVVRVTHRTRLVDGVRVRVVRDRAYVGGELVEDTRDWYAQDRRGNVWYFGENTKTLEERQGHQHEGLVGCRAQRGQRRHRDGGAPQGR